ncbi:MAG TPA: glycoside hydrolase family 16 protein [Acetobacteraceae bacterium]|nr:glycoside hydrolase family 16 protein [Acetobacteraceae bacterium]
MANVTLDTEFDSLGTIWQPTYPWSPDGFTFGDSSWMANPALVPPDADPISCNNGTVTLANFPTPSDVNPASVGDEPRIGGLLTTDGTFSQTYGYFEASIQMPAGQGITAGFWLDTPSGLAPQLDVAEMIGGDPTTLVNTAWPSATAESNWTDVTDMSQGFNTYAVDWEPDYITWYFNGRQTAQIPTPSDMNQPMFLVADINSGTDGSWEGAPSASLVAQMKIAYVRAYTANPYTTGGALTYQSGDPSSQSASATPTTSTTSGQTDPTTAASGDPAAGSPTASGSATDETVAAINTVTVQSGSRQLTAVSGPDMFVFDGTGYRTVIKDFVPGVDTLDFESGAAPGSIAVTSNQHGWARIAFDGSHIVLPGVTADQLNSGNFIFNGQSSG